MRRKILMGLAAIVVLIAAAGIYIYCTLDFWIRDPLTFPANDRYSVEAVPFRNPRGQQIFGVAYVPKGPKGQKYPLVILSHGYSSSHQFLTGYGTRLAARGIAVLSFDFAGGSNLSKSEGNTTQMSVLTEKEDLKAALARARTLPFVDNANIYLSGESQGGFVTALAAVEVADEIRGQILLYPAFHIPDAMRKSYPGRKGIEPVMDFPNHMKIGRGYVDAVYDMDAYKSTRSFSKPVLIIHGDADKAVPISYSERAVKEYPSATLKVIKGAGHVFFWKRDVEQAVQYMIAFIGANSPGYPNKPNRH